MSAATVDPFETNGRGPQDRLLPEPVTVSADSWSETTSPSLPRWSSRPRGGGWVVDAAARAGLTGHGGGHFPAARKWRAAIDHPAPVTLVVNGAESEWLSAKDAVLLRLRPHLVLDGAALLAETVGAARTVLWMHESARATRRAVELACRQRSASGCVEPPVTIMSGPSTYLSGESTAVKNAVHGGPVVPQFRSANGSRTGSQTLVHNVETLARVALLAESVPTQDRWPPLSTRQRLLTVLTPVNDRCVIEAVTSTRLAEVMEAAIGHQPAAATPVLLGGYGGTWARWSEVACLPVSERSMSRAGHPLGPGIVAPLWSGGCGLAATARIVTYLARSGAGQCGPCLFGLPAMAGSLTRLVEGSPRPREAENLRRDADAVGGRGACHAPDGAVRVVRSALDVFADDVEVHASGHRCQRPTSALIPVPEAAAR